MPNIEAPIISQPARNRNARGRAVLVLAALAAALGGNGPASALASMPQIRTESLPGAREADGGSRHEYTAVHMGLPVRMVLYQPDAAHARDAAVAAFARIATLDAMMSDYRARSEVSRLPARASDRWIRPSPEVFAVLTRAVEIAQVTGGAFDPTVGPLAALWRQARRDRQLPDAATLADVRRQVGWTHVRLDRARQAVRFDRAGMRLDLGGIAKGWILQDAARVLRERGVARFLLEAGGDIVVGDPPPGADGWRIETPGADSEFAARAARLRQGALATSGPAAQFVEIGGTTYSHVVDPRTGLGLTRGVTAYVIAPDGATADALATALTVAGPARARRLVDRFPGVTASVR